MTSAFQPLIPAQPTFTETGLARSDRYDDVYHSASGALEQAHYVFLQGNGLPERWQGREQFTILETGFGLGNNFLATWHAWRSDEQRSQRLHFVSFETHPFSKADLAHMLRHTPAALRDLADELIAQWPLLLPGIHRLKLQDETLSLTLIFGDIAVTAKRMSCQVDAFYLDGFAPRVNPVMWSKELFGQLVRMSAPQATAATWCSATEVRKNLQDAGFIVERHPGFAFKRHMIRAQLRAHLGHSYPKTPTQMAVIVGGGIAGAATAFSLAQRGIATTVLDPVFAQGLGGAHAGHVALAMTPQITLDDAPRARLSRAGLLLAHAVWREFIGSSIDICGSLVVSTDKNEAKSYQQAVEQLGFDADWVQYMNAQEASMQAKTHLTHGALFFPQGARVRPQQLLQQLLTHPLIRPKAEQVQSLLKTKDNRWQLITSCGQLYNTDLVVIANSTTAPTLLRPLLQDAMGALDQLDVLGGQSAEISAQALVQPAQGIVAGHGYLIEQDANRYVVGSTYDPDSVAVTPKAHTEILQKIAGLMALNTNAAAPLSSWFGVRAALKDHLPMVCQARPGLWLNIGYGSYGFSWAAAAAETISTYLCAEPAVLERDLLRALDLR